MRINYPKKVTFSLKASDTRTITKEDKMEDPKAEIVYWTENGPDKKSWDIIFPEYKVLSEAFRGGYGWYDLTEGQGQHLLPKPKPYKIVNVSSSELKAIRAREAEVAQEEQKALTGEKPQEAYVEKLSMDEKFKKEPAAAELPTAELAAAERTAMAQEDSYSELINMSEYISNASNKIMKDIQVLSSDLLNQDYLKDFIYCRLLNYKEKSRESIAILVCEIIESKNMLCNMPLPLPSPQVEKQQLEEIKTFFNSNPPFYHGGYKYLPYVYNDGRKLFVPEVYLCNMLGQNIILYHPLPPLLSAYEFSINQPESNIYFADEIFVPINTFDGRRIYVPQWQTSVYMPPLPPQPPPPTPPKQPYHIKCKDTYCQMCYPLPLIPLQIMNDPLPLNFKIIKTITLLPPNNKIKKNELNKLVDDCSSLQIDPDILILFSKSGFSSELKSLKSEKFKLFSVKHLKQLI